MNIENAAVLKEEVAEHQAGVEPELGELPALELVADDPELGSQFELLGDDDEFMSTEESAALIKEHNDALNGVVEPASVPADSAVQEEVADAQAESPELAADPASESLLEQAIGDGVDAEPDPFDGFKSARDFMTNGGSISGLVEKLNKPPVKAMHSPSELPLDAPLHAHSQAQAAGADPRVQMGLGQAALMTGAYGLSKLSKLLADGAGMLGEPLHAWQLKKAETKLSSSLSTLDSRLNSFRSLGLSELDNDSLSLSDRQEMARQFFAQPDQKAALNEVFSSVNELRRNARVVMEKSMDRGATAEEAAENALEPLRRFTDANEKFLESLKMGDETMLEKMDNVLNGLFEMLKQMVARITEMLGVGNKQSTEPRMG
ncbi:hypothetical protein [Pseudomonas sp.]|uniref:hypothetical protein n=1 Tax=Pseudomonas sp. TaxID=306 RepID=UPI002915AC03|nr:hypothetical protein [Pseudomonas sp.]MDU4254469.1 hypothetical protein [Pseudomonas sp.]